MTTEKRKKRALGSIGLALGLLALSGAFLSPWIQEWIDPPGKALEEDVVDFAERLAQAAKAKMEGEDYVAPPAAVPEPKPSRHLFPAIIGMGMVAAAFGLLSLLRSEPPLRTCLRSSE